MEDDDDFERIAGKTRTESAELRRQSEARRPGTRRFWPCRSRR
jgi:hypothetical protein